MSEVTLGAGERGRPTGVKLLLAPQPGGERQLVGLLKCGAETATAVVVPVPTRADDEVDGDDDNN